MKHGLCALCLAATLVAGSPAFADDTPSDEPPAVASDDGMAGNVQFLLGQAYLGDFWKPFDRPSSFGVEVDFAPKKSPVRVALAINVFGDGERVTSPYFGETGSVGVGFLEFSAGFLWHPVKHGVARPYLGAGVLRMFAGVGAGSDFWIAGDSDQSFGYYGNAGIFFKVGDSFNIGIDGRFVGGTSITLAGLEGEADSSQVSLLLGFSWGE